MMGSPSVFLSPSVGDYSLKKILHFLCREAKVDVREFARMNFIMYFSA